MLEKERTEIAQGSLVVVAPIISRPGEISIACSNRGLRAWMASCAHQLRRTPLPNCLINSWRGVDHGRLVAQDGETGGLIPVLATRGTPERPVRIYQTVSLGNSVNGGSRPCKRIFPRI